MQAAYQSKIDEILYREGISDRNEREYKLLISEQEVSKSASGTFVAHPTERPGSFKPAEILA
jgi:hypothetical protein